MEFGRDLLSGSTFYTSVPITIPIPKVNIKGYLIAVKQANLQIAMHT